VEKIIQREINRFVLETFGRFLEPTILAAVRRELHPQFREGDLSAALATMLGASSEPLAGRVQVPQSKPAAPPPPLEPAPVIQERVSEPEPEPPAPPRAEVSEQQDLMERLIRIIMDATGFNRDEIQPDMDLRKDLSIRSSRLPLIMDAAESQFGITIELEDFINVRTVQDIAERIAGILANQDGGSLQPAATFAEGDPGGDEGLKPADDAASLKRLVFSRVAVEKAASMPITFGSGDSVVCLQLTKAIGLPAG
jgi:acyl carrier protein